MYIVHKNSNECNKEINDGESNYIHISGFFIIINIYNLYSSNINTMKLKKSTVIIKRTWNLQQNLNFVSSL